MWSDFLSVSIIVSVLTATIRISTPILYAAMGELITERSGIMNMGVEGTMLMGAFFGFYMAYETGSLITGIVVAVVVGGLMGLFMAFMAVTLKVNQTVTGLSINLLAAGLTLFLFRISYEVGNTPSINPLDRVAIPYLSKIPIFGQVLFNQGILTYLVYLMVPVIYIFLYKTKYGLAIRGIGENPKAADTRGLNVTRYQYSCTIFGGMMSGLGGAFITIGSLANFLPGIIAGRGWLAVVLVIAGNWHPRRILFATIIFAFLDALQFQLQGVGVPVPHQILLVLPFVVALLVMMGSRVRSVAPKSLAKPYYRE